VGGGEGEGSVIIRWLAFAFRAKQLLGFRLVVREYYLHRVSIMRIAGAAHRDSRLLCILVRIVEIDQLEFSRI
jgi:hypothetical protein